MKNILQLEKPRNKRTLWPDYYLPATRSSVWAYKKAIKFTWAFKLNQPIISPLTTYRFCIQLSIMKQWLLFLFSNKCTPDRALLNFLRVKWSATYSVTRIHTLLQSYHSHHKFWILVAFVLFLASYLTKLITFTHCVVWDIVIMWCQSLPFNI